MNETEDRRSKYTNEFDPISLEPVNELECIFEYRFINHVYCYDSWVWLEWLLTPPVHICGKHLHPIFSSIMTCKDIFKVYKKCREHFNKEHKKWDTQLQLKRENMLNNCESAQVTKTIKRNAEGKIISLLIKPVSPFRSLMIKEVQHKNAVEENMLVSPIKCTAKITYLLSSPDNEVFIRTLYI